MFVDCETFSECFTKYKQKYRKVKFKNEFFKTI